MHFNCISFDVILVDITTKEKVKNSNRIPLDLAIYTSENPPKMLRNNTLGFTNFFKN